MNLCLLFLTYNRPQYAEKALRAAIENSMWNGELRVHIADDGSPNDYAEYLRTVAGGYDKVHSTGISNSERRGYGANYNLATQHIHPWADFVLAVEDDWVLTRTLDLDELVNIFSDPIIGCVRMGYLGFTQELYSQFKRVGEKIVLLLDPMSAEPHVFAGHPRLETVAWEKAMGPWPEGFDPNRTEFMCAEQMRHGIAWPMWLNPNGGLWEHIGSERAR